jgi:outer membrane protein
MKNTLLVWCTILSAAAFIFSVLNFFDKERIVYVDSLRLVANYDGAKSAKKTFQKKVSVWKSNVDSLTKELNAHIERYEKEKKSLSKKDLQVSEELIQTRQTQLENYQQVISEGAQKEDREITTAVLKEVNDFLKRYGKQKGYQFILSANTVGNIVYADPSNDKTDEVIEKLNEEYKSMGK